MRASVGRVQGTEDKPTAAFVLSLIAGILILLNGLLIAVLGALVAVFFFGLGLVLAALGLGFGILVLLGAVMMYYKPSQHVTWGVVVLVFSIVSIFIGGGFIIGLILGLVGGILALVWKPETMRMCMRCGRPLLANYYACPYCGTPVAYAPGWYPGIPYPGMPPGMTPTPPLPAPGPAPAAQPAAPGATKCRTCGADVAPGQAFCQNCGTKM